MRSVQLLDVRGSGWYEYLARVPHDFYHTQEYHRFTSANDGAEAWLAVYGTVEKFVAWPYLLQEIPEFNGAFTRGLRDITSVYGYAGPVAYNCSSDAEFLDCAWAGMIEAWRSQGAVSVFTRLHPLLCNHTFVRSHCVGACPQGVLGGAYALGSTVFIDLTLTSSEIWGGYKRQLRQALRRCQSVGMTTTPDPHWTALDDFVRLYHSTMERNHAPSYYFFTAEYLHALQQALGVHGGLIVTRHGDEIIAAALLIEYAGIVNVHLLATDNRFTNLSPSKLIIHEAQVWAHARGNRVLHLGGGRGNRDDDPLFRFKSLFSRERRPFYTGRWILDWQAYRFLSEQRKPPARAEFRESMETHFPAYRARSSSPEM